MMLSTILSLMSPLLLPMAEAASLPPAAVATGALPSVSVVHYILCHGTGQYLSYIPPIGLTAFGPSSPHTYKLTAVDDVQGGGIRITRPGHSLELAATQAGTKVVPMLVSPTNKNIWRIDGASGQVSGVRLITTYNNVDYYLATSEDHGLLMYTQEELQLVPNYEVMFDIVAV